VTVTRRDFGRMSDGRNVEAFTFTTGAGAGATVITYGAAIQSVVVPGRDGRLADVAPGFTTLDGYLDHGYFFGATIGRVANRIKDGVFTLDGRTYHVPLNNGPNSLHGGARGFDKVVWDVVSVTDDGVTLRHVSPDGDMGYPGALTATAVYRFTGDELSVTYEATTDAPTVVNLSSHAYWNMAGDGAAGGAMGHILTIPADEYSPTDATAIPTGEFRPVDGTPFDFRTPTPIGARVRDAGDEQIRIGKGYDHNWVVSREPAAEPRLVARLEDPASGRVLEVLSDQPGLQFYSGNFLDGAVSGKSGRLYRQGDAVALEPQKFPDTPNRPGFGSVRLDPGQTYRNRILFRFTVA